MPWRRGKRRAAVAGGVDVAARRCVDVVVDSGSLTARYTHGRSKRVGLMPRSRLPFNVVGNAFDCRSKWSRQWSVVFGRTRLDPCGFHGNGHVVRLIDTRVGHQQ